jgi:hypothetical protein
MNGGIDGDYVGGRAAETPTKKKKKKKKEEIPSGDGGLELSKGIGLL